MPIEPLYLALAVKPMAAVLFLPDCD